MAVNETEELRKAALRFESIAGLLQAYPRPSLDPNGRLLLDAREAAKAAAQDIWWKLGGRK